ncbi:MAG: hypothetical protein WCR15_05170, partial [Arcobacteraceae bacterium]
MSIKISIKDKNSNTRNLELSNPYNEIVVEYGDCIFVDEVKNNLQFDSLNDIDLKLFFNNNCTVVLKNLIKLLIENPNEDIPAQFNDMSILNAITTQLEFVKSDLFDESCCIKDFQTLHNIIQPKKHEESSLHLLHKSVRFQYEKAKTVHV